MAEKIDLKALAKLFGMNVSELARFMGYTKQALYQLNDGTSGICTERYYKALKQLQFQNEKLYEDDLQEAQLLKQERERYIQQMCRNVSAVNVTEI
ncbi:MAG: hypothetical protein K2K74_04280 [Lachnospiraceae bacterium]|nr:hypothetical protein [Lachnospiraceae bacterium]